MRNPATTKLLIVAITLFLLASSVTGFMLYTLENKGARLIKDLQQIKDQALVEAEYIKLRSVIAETDDSRQQLERLFIKGDEDTVAFLSEVDQLAKDLNLSLVTKKLDVSQTATAGFDELDVQFGIVGDQRAVIKLLQLFELIPYYSRVAEFNAAIKPDPSTGRSAMDASVTLKLSIKEN